MVMKAVLFRTTVDDPLFEKRNRYLISSRYPSLSRKDIIVRRAEGEKFRELHRQISRLHPGDELIISSILDLTRKEREITELLRDAWRSGVSLTSLKEDFFDMKRIMPAGLTEEMAGTIAAGMAAIVVSHKDREDVTREMEEAEIMAAAAEEYGYQKENTVPAKFVNAKKLEIFVYRHHQTFNPEKGYSTDAVTKLFNEKYGMDYTADAVKKCVQRLKKTVETVFESVAARINTESCKLKEPGESDRKVLLCFEAQMFYQTVHYNCYDEVISRGVIRQECIIGLGSGRNLRETIEYICLLNDMKKISYNETYLANLILETLASDEKNIFRWAEDAFALSSDGVQQFAELYREETEGMNNEDMHAYLEDAVLGGKRLLS